MSYDFELFAGSAARLAASPVISTGNISFDGPDRVEYDDIPEAFLPIVGKKRWLYRIHLEGKITEKDRLVIDHWLRDVIVASRGVLIDLQTGTYETVTKSGSVAADHNKPLSIGSMSFHFADGEGFYEHGFEALFQVMTETFPAALPTRYGYYEPLQGKIVQGDFAEIVSAFKNDTQIFMKSPAPFGHIFISVPCKKTFEHYHPKHFIRRHHLFGRVKFELRPAVFSSPTNRSALIRLFKTLCVKLNVVYAEILETEEKGSSWFWYGLPERQSAHAICIGSAYQGVWPDASRGGEVLGDQLRVFIADRFGNAPPRPPLDLISPNQPMVGRQEKPVCAPIFPFDYQFDCERYLF